MFVSKSIFVFLKHYVCLVCICVHIYMIINVHVYVYMGLGAWSLYILACFVLCIKYVCKYVIILCVNLYVYFNKFVYVCDWCVIIFVKDYFHPKVYILCLLMFLLQLLSNMMQFINTLKSTKF